MSAVVETDEAELPAGWVRARLGNVVSFTKRPRGLTPAEQVPFLPMAAISESELDVRNYEMRAPANAKSGTYFEDGNLLVARITPCFENGKQGLVHDVPGGWGMATTEVYALSSEVLHLRYLSLYLRQASVHSALVAKMEGATGRMRLPQRALEDLPLAFPEDGCEQERIVTAVESFMEAIAAGAASFGAALSGVEDFQSALYAEAMSGRLAAPETGDRPAAELLASLGATDATEIERDPIWPAHWGVTTVGQLATKVTSGSRDWKPFYNRGSGVFVLTGNVRMRRLDLSEVLHVDPPATDPARARSAVAMDDLLLTIVGANVGNVARVPTVLEDHFACQSLALIRLKMPAMSRFLELYMSSPHGGQRYFEGCFYGQGRPHISFDDIKRMPVPVPPPEERERIVAAFERYVNEGRQLAQRLRMSNSDAASLRQAVLANAFCGGLTPVFNGVADSNSDRAVLVGEYS